MTANANRKSATTEGPAVTRADLEAEFTRTLAPHFPRGVPVSLVASLSLAASGYTATQIERHARPDPWPPRRQRVDEGQAVRRQREQEARRTA